MKIAFLIDEYRNPCAGTERQLHLLARELRATGHDVRLGVLRHTSYTESGAFPAPVDDLAAPRIAEASAWLRLHRWGRRLRRAGFDLVHVYFNDSAVLGPWPLRLAGLRVVVSRRDMGFWYTPAMLWALRASSPAVDVLVANCDAAGRKACAEEWVSENKLCVIHNGLELSAIADASQDPEVPEPPAGGRVGIVANCRPVKRVEDLVRAFASLAMAHPETDLAIVGGGDRDHLRKLAGELGVEKRILWPGQVPDARPWVETFDVAVLCSESEGLSNAIMEYMALGKPVVATDTGGNPELVEPGHSGLLVPVGEPSALAGAIGRLLGDRALARRMGAAGRNRLAEGFSVEQMVARHLDLYGALSHGAESGPASLREAR